MSGIRDLIEDEMTSLLVPACDADKLAEGITQMLAGRAEASAFAVAARQRLQEQHSASASAVRQAELYVDLVERSSWGKLR